MKVNFILSNQYIEAIGKTITPEFLTWLQKTKKVWVIKESKTLKTIEKVTHLKFKKSSLECYVNPAFSISDPLSIMLVKDPQINIENLTHELIHVILTQNYPKIKRSWDAYFKKLGNKPMVFKSHVVVHAIHELIVAELSPLRLKKVIGYSTDKEYIKSWKYIKSRGAQTIVNEALGLSKK